MSRKDISATPADLKVLDEVPLKKPAPKWRNKYLLQKDMWMMCCDTCIILEETRKTVTLIGCGVFPTAEIAEHIGLEVVRGRPGAEYKGPVPCAEDGTPL